MAGKISITCPECSAKLNVPETVIGKKIKCPKCQDVFKAETMGEDSPDDFDDLPEEEEKPLKRRAPASGRANGAGKSSTKKSKKGQSSGNGSTIGLIVGGSLGLIVLVGAGLFFSGALSPKPVSQPAATTSMVASTTANALAEPVTTAATTAPVTTEIKPEPPVTKPAVPVVPPLSSGELMLGLRWFPADTDLIVHAKVSDIFSAPLLKGPLSDPAAKQSQNEFQEQFGIDPRDIESVTFGICNISDMLNSNILATMSGQLAGALAENGRFLFVIKTKAPVDPKIVSAKAPEF